MTTACSLDLPAVVAVARHHMTALADPENAAPMAAYLKTTQPFLGLKATGRRAVEKELRRFKVPDAPTYRGLVRALWDQPEREFQQLAIDVAVRHKRFIHPDQLDLFEQLVREGQWWDLVDPIAAKLVGGAWSAHRPTISREMDRWIEDPDLWIRRTAILGQLRHKQDTDTERLFAYCRRCMHETDFFMRKAIGWALRTHADVDPAPVQDFLTTHWAALAGLSRREASRKMVARGWQAPT